jgi:hypothetical protein
MNMLLTNLVCQSPRFIESEVLCTQTPDLEQQIMDMLFTPRLAPSPLLEVGRSSEQDVYGTVHAIASMSLK